MEYNIFEEKLVDLCNKIDIDITNLQCKQIYKYMNLIIEWNEKINLTNILKPEEMILKHFIDSLTINKYIKKDNNIVDIGTGAGFPGIPLSIINENNVTLVDSLQKKVNFLEDVKNKLELKNIICIHSRAEEFSQNKLYREKYDISVSRAVASLSVLAEYLLPTLKIGGNAICMKGPNIDEEIEDAKFSIKTLGGKIISIDKFTLPDSDISRTIILIEKIKETHKKYPRKAGTPVREPLSLFHT